MKKKYIDALVKELGSYSGLLKTVPGFDTVFIGGGTPSILDIRQTEALLGAIAPMIKNGAEFTVECNPGTLDREKLELYRSFGVNRLSIGLQSADDDELKLLGRIHTFREFLVSFDLAREAGFNNINIDLMSGLPGQSVSRFKKTLETVGSLNPEHISAYSLIIEPETAFFELYGEKGRLKDDLPEEETDREIYRMTKDVLEGFGFHRYEISNYSRPGFECRHNTGYWRGEEYLGAGIGAASYIGNERNKNTSDINKYLKCIESDDPEMLTELKEESEKLDGRDKIEEYIILGLRMTEGIDTADFKSRFGFLVEERYKNVIDKNIANGLLKLSGGKLYLTERGLDLANSVMVDFLD